MRKPDPSKWAGFTVRATYGLVQMIAIGAEVTAVAIYFGYWLPHVPQWVWVSTASLALVAVNSLQVGRFGEFEYWFAMIKVSAIIAFIVAGAALIFGVGAKPALGFSNLTANGGFLPFGFKGVWLAVTLALTSYMGIEVIAVTAGEAQDPQASVPKAMRTIVFRLIIFYVIAILAMLAMTPWRQLGSGNGIRWQPVCQSIFWRRHSLRSQHYEPGGHYRGSLQLQHRSLPHHPHAFLAIERGLRSVVAWTSRRQWCATSRSGRLYHRHGSRYSVGDLRSQSGFPVVVWSGSSGNVLRMDGNSYHSSPLSQIYHELRNTTSYQTDLLAILQLAWDWSSRRHNGNYFLCRWAAILRSRVPAISSRPVSDVLEIAEDRFWSLTPITRGPQQV